LLSSFAFPCSAVVRQPAPVLQGAIQIFPAEVIIRPGHMVLISFGKPGFVRNIAAAPFSFRTPNSEKNQ
jgi:hypothetical protein